MAASQAKRIFGEVLTQRRLSQRKRAAGCPPQLPSPKLLFFPSPTRTAVTLFAAMPVDLSHEPRDPAVTAEAQRAEQSRTAAQHESLVYASRIGRHQTTAIPEARACSTTQPFRIARAIPLSSPRTPGPITTGLNHRRQSRHKIVVTSLLATNDRCGVWVPGKARQRHARSGLARDDDREQQILSALREQLVLPKSAA